MTDLPTKTHLTGGSATEAQFQSAIGALYDYAAEIAGMNGREELELVSGAVTPTKGFIIVDTENQTATDDLSTITPTNLGEKTLWVRGKSVGRDVTLKHAAGGTVQLQMCDNADVTLTNTHMTIVFQYNSTTTTWVEIHRNFGLYLPSAGMDAAARTSLGLGTAAILDSGAEAGDVVLNGALGALAYLGQIALSHIPDGLITKEKLADAAAAGSLLGYNSAAKAAELPPGAVGEVLTSQGAGKLPTYGPSGITEFTSGNNLRYHDPNTYTNSSLSNTSQSIWRKGPVVTTPLGGALRIKFLMFEVGSVTYRSMKASLRVNGVEVYIDSTTSSGTGNTSKWVDTDIEVEAGDEISVWIKVSNIAQASYISANMRDLQILTAEPVTEFIVSISEEAESIVVTSS